MDTRNETITKDSIYYNILRNIYFDAGSVDINGSLTHKGDIYHYSGNHYTNDITFFNKSNILLQLANNTVKINEDIIVEKGLVISNYSPNQTNNKLYQISGQLYWNGSILGNSTISNSLTDLNLSGFLNVARDATISGNIITNRLIGNMANISGPMYVLDNSVFYGNLSANSISIGSGNLSLNNLNSTNITGISATIHGNLSANTLSISSGNLSITNLNSTNITGTSATIHGNLSANTLSISSGNLSITNLNSTNITGTSITTGNLSTINANINSITSSLITNSNLICANIIGDTVFYGNQINKQAITLNGYEPSIKANTLYNKFGNIYWNDRQLDITNNSTAITSNIILDNGTYKWKFEIDASNGDMVFYKFNGNTYIEKQRIG